MKKALTIVLLLTFLIPAPALAQSTTGTATVHTSGGNRTVTKIEMELSHGSQIRAMSAQDTFGRASATLEEFAAAAQIEYGMDAVIFPVNFFVTATFEIVGGLYSQGRIVSAGPQPWLNWGVGFDAQHQMSFFNGRFNNGYIYGEAWYAPRLEHIQTAFNAYPHLINNGNRINIQPAPGMTASWLAGRVRRAFMGQRADGTLVVGVVDGTNINELQDIVQHFGLVTATNVDGGASAGIWRNGQVLVQPGRRLASVMVVTSPPPPPPEPQVPGLPFVDIHPNDWFIPSIRYVYDNGIMTGNRAYLFAPEISINRAMVATILRRMKGEQPVIFRQIYGDVNGYHWFADAVTWAHDEGLVRGIGGGNFAPDRYLSRQELAAMLFRYARARELDITVSEETNSPFSDMDEIAPWALDYMLWAVYNGFFTTSGTGGEHLNPEGTVSRAETAAFIHAFSLKYGNQN